MLPSAMPRLINARVALRAFETRDRNLVASVADDPLIPLITTVPDSGSPEDVAATCNGSTTASPPASGTRSRSPIATPTRPWARLIYGRRRSAPVELRPATGSRNGSDDAVYVRAALQALTDWALSHEEVQRLHLFVEPWNEGSWRTAEACGYQREGLLRDWERVGDTRKNMYVYSVIRAAASGS